MGLPPHSPTLLVILHDKTPLVGLAGTVAALTLNDARELVGIVAGLATVVYIVSKTVILWQTKRPPQE